MTIKRIIVEQIDNAQEETTVVRPQSNWDSFSNGFTKGYTLKGVWSFLFFIIVLFFLGVLIC